MKRIDYSKVEITGGFWREKQDLVRQVTVNAVYDRFFETGRFDAFKCDGSVNPHIFWDSDVAKWIEGVAYLTREKREPALEKIVDEVVDEIEKHRDPCGYFNSYFLTVDKDKRFSHRDNHELYCLGHLIEAGVAYYEATGKDKLLKLMCDYVSYVEDVFKNKGTAAFKTPGHEEIELALVRLYECTGETKYLELSKYFIDQKGYEESDPLCSWTEFAYSQSHLPVRQQETAEGHAVRAAYLYCAMADLALKLGDEELKEACKKIFDDIATKKMYITGGIGSSSEGEAFTDDYDLPNLTAYAESCAALALALFANRMLLLETDAKYADVVERAIYNGFMSSTSLDGKAFFYANPLEILPRKLTCNKSVKNKNPLNLPKPQRQEVFFCSCCPPNIVRFIPSIANLLYTCDEDTLYIHQFMESRAKITVGGKEYEVIQKTSYPNSGKVEISIKGGSLKVAVRVPSWSNEYPNKAENGYLYYEINDTGSSISLDFNMKPRFVYANPEVIDNAGKCALTYGPLVYCMEGHDNEGHLRNIVLDTNSEIKAELDPTLGAHTLYVGATVPSSSCELYSFTAPKRKDVTAKLIPYFAFANRELCEMQVWHLYK